MECYSARPSRSSATDDVVSERLLTARRSFRLGGTKGGLARTAAGGSRCPWRGKGFKIPVRSSSETSPLAGRHVWQIQLRSSGEAVSVSSGEHVERERAATACCQAERAVHKPVLNQL